MPEHVGVSQASSSDDETVADENGASSACFGSAPFEGNAGLIIKISLFVALTWWGFGIYTVIITQSLAVLASLVDATIDLLAQGVLLMANRLAEDTSVKESYPVGVARLEPVGVIVCAVLMVLASGAVIWDCGDTLVTSFPDGSDMEFTIDAATLLAVVVVVKIMVWRIAKREYDRTNNVSLEALALDNYNDILSNASALLFASLTRLQQSTWWMDPVGGILISFYIIRSWYLTAQEQTTMLVGRQADPEFVDQVRAMAVKHHVGAQVRGVRAYHFGPKVLVEIDLVMDGETRLADVHHVGITLQDQVERLEECERCFVHIDTHHRDVDMHDTAVAVHDKVARRPRNSNSLRLRTVMALRKHSESVSMWQDGSNDGRPRAQSDLSESMRQSASGEGLSSRQLSDHPFLVGTAASGRIRANTVA